jgi:hypothetical protein
LSGGPYHPEHPEILSILIQTVTNYLLYTVVMAKILFGKGIHAGIMGVLFGGGGDRQSTTGGQVAVVEQPAQQAAPAQPTFTPTSEPPTVTPLPPDTPTPAPVIGQDVLVGEVRWKMLTAENLGNQLVSNNQFIDPLNTAGKFIKVRFEIENRSKDMQSFIGFDLIDSQGREFTSSSDAFMFIDGNEACVLVNLNPNLPKTCTAIYEVPADATGLKAYVGDLSIFGRAEAQIELGL